MSDVMGNLFLAFRDYERNWRQTVYAYRISETGKLIKPYLFRSTGVIEDDSDLLCFLRDDYGGGEFRIFIRDGSKMVFSGDVAICKRIQRY